jgi:hypothetical protein
MSLLKHASGVLPLAVQHLPQTKSTASAGERTATPTPTSLQNFVVGATVSILVIAMLVGVIAALSVSG